MCASGYLPKARQKRNASKYLQNELLVTLFVVCWDNQSDRWNSDVQMTSPYQWLGELSR